MKLKRLTIPLGDRQMTLQSVNLKNDQQITTPIEFDPEKEIAIQHISDTEKQVFHLAGLLMYKYEEEKSLIQ